MWTCFLGRYMSTLYMSTFLHALPCTHTFFPWRPLLRCSLSTLTTHLFFLYHWCSIILHTTPYSILLLTLHYSLLHTTAVASLCMRSAGPQQRCSLSLSLSHPEEWRTDTHSLPPRVLHTHTRARPQECCSDTLSLEAFQPFSFTCVCVCAR